MAFTYEKKYRQITDLFNVTCGSADVGEGICVDILGEISITGETFFGIAYNDAETDEQLALVNRINDVTWVVLAESQTIAVGDYLTPTTAGQVKEAVATEIVTFRALEAVTTAAGANAYIPVVIVSKVVKS